MKIKTSLTKNSSNPSSRHFGTTAGLLVALVLGQCALSPPARAECRDGCNNTNTFQGEDALLSNASGHGNTAIGNQALHDNTTGFWNTANGAFALTLNAKGRANTATGFAALASNTIGNSNTANGAFALTLNTGFGNTAIAAFALEFNTTGNANTAIGWGALIENRTGNDNTATGASALDRNTTGNNNTASGRTALESNTTGNDNTAVGFQALSDNTTGSSNIAVGSNAGSNLTTGSNNIDIGNAGVADESNTVRIGNGGTQTATYMAGITGIAVVGDSVVVNGSGQLGTVASSERFKEKIKPMDKVSEAILALKPVTFRYKKQLDPDGIPQFGLVAEEVGKVNPDLVARDEQGKPYSVRYEAVNAMLLNEFLKARRQIDAQQKQIDALTAGLQKVSAQLELSKSAPQTALNDQ